nr:DUF21 domain-containing protein At4g14240-like [Tanacetum cinerariifolium]
MDHEIGTCGMAIDYCILKEEVSILRGRKSVPGISSSDRENGKKGLTLGLMSLGLVELEILQRSGSNREKKQAAAILPVVQKQHQLLVTLLLCNAAAME